MQWAGCSAVWPGLGWLRSTAAAGGGVGWNGRGVYGGCQLPAAAGRGGEGDARKNWETREREAERAVCENCADGSQRQQQLP